MKSLVNFKAALAAVSVLIGILLIPLLFLYLFRILDDVLLAETGWEQAHYLAGIISGLVTALGISAAAFSYIRNSNEEKYARELTTHAELNNRYVEFLKLAADNPSLPIQDFIYGDQKDPRDCLDDIQYKRLISLYLILNSLFERAYLAYFGHDSDFKVRQWNGWHFYIISWMSRCDFRNVWLNYIRSEEYDGGFNDFIEQSYRCALVLDIVESDFRVHGRVADDVISRLEKMDNNNFFYGIESIAGKKTNLARLLNILSDLKMIKSDQSKVLMGLTR